MPRAVCKRRRLWYNGIIRKKGAGIMGKELYWKATLRIVDGAGERCFGPGVAALLEGVEERGSLRAAAISMEMAYSKAWRILRRAEDAFGCKLLQSTTGGKNGGGAALTPEGAALLKAYRDYTAAVERCCAEEFTRHFGAFQKEREN